VNDIALVWDTTKGAADFVVEDNDLLTDDGLETAVLLSLFLDRRAEDGDVLPDGETDRRGWWGDAFPVVEGDRIGSRLWLLARSKQTQEVVDRAKEYATEALQWLIDDKVAARVDVESEIVRNGIIGIGVSIHRPKQDVKNYRWNYTWASQEARRVS
jgi:phage gp46-like protein